MKKYDKPEFEIVFYDEKDNIMLSAVDGMQPNKNFKKYSYMFNS